MSQLTTNTASLQAILDTVNALPEAGGGGGVYKVAEGSFALNISSAAPIESGIATVEGLAFKPFCVMVTSTSTVTASTTGRNYFVSCQQVDGYDPLCFRLLKVSSSSLGVYTGGTMIASITMADDGFTLYNGEYSNMYYAKNYDYVAIGY